MQRLLDLAQAASAECELTSTRRHRIEQECMTVLVHKVWETRKEATVFVNQWCASLQFAVRQDDRIRSGQVVVWRCEDSSCDFSFRARKVKSGWHLVKKKCLLLLHSTSCKYMGGETGPTCRSPEATVSAGITADVLVTTNVAEDLASVLDDDDDDEIVLAGHGPSSAFSLDMGDSYCHDDDEFHDVWDLLPDVRGQFDEPLAGAVSQLPESLDERFQNTQNPLNLSTQEETHLTMWV